MGIGRPTKLNNDRMKEILARLSVGNTRKCAAECSGVHIDTFMGWMSRGRNGEAPYSEFVELVTRAEKQAEDEALSAVRKAAQGFDVERIEETIGKDGLITKTVRTREFDWRAAAWFLERRHGKTWREKKTIDITQLSNEQLLALLDSEDEGEEGTGAEGSRLEETEV